jgi:hypothetical protein
MSSKLGIHPTWGYTNTQELTMSSKFLGVCVALRSWPPARRLSGNMLGVAVKTKRKEPKRAGEDAAIGYGAHERGGSVTAVVTALGCDDRTAISLLAKHGGDHSAVIRAGTR